MERPDWVPDGIDVTRPSAARMYDYYLGGSHNFEADREAAAKAIEMWPDLPKIMQANRAFMRRAVRHAVELGVTQFLDIGSGIPTFGNVHEVARAADPQSRVVYVDRDPIAVAHSQALLEGDTRTGVIEADLRDGAALLEHPGVTGVLDLERPVALLLVAVLHFVQDADGPWDAVAELRERLAPGSLLILSHATPEGRADMAGPHQDLYRRTGNPMSMRSRSEVTRFFEGFEMLDPGLVYMAEWRPDPGCRLEDPTRFSGFAGVGRKP
ncbi:SAM-dependent methyltransferase [Streptomyces sp. HB2AG]|uniref:SAM-dependent methyltransferase n=1 Tax=Streptomyces sp. HB2AG TaxID=2983400 RepID=UPI0022AAF6C8|nr:SAM-dependent methyltransferase [Streptomyces sp. HB2AG]MCZ2525275.1 SAM-dependent methyltransferase [Streptomyces sp. HB2AG]